MENKSLKYQIEEVHASKRTPEERLESWRSFLLLLDQNEHELSEISLGLGGGQIQDFTEKGVNFVLAQIPIHVGYEQRFKDSIEPFVSRLLSLVERIKLPISRERETILHMEYYLKTMQVFKEAEIEVEEKIKNIVNDSVSAFLENPCNKKDFLNHQQSMITHILFQSPHITHANSGCRSISVERAKLWDSTAYLQKCYAKLSEAFINL